ncbi:hypothetical protein HHI36_017318 [Cryptolaemus montrouzieri]|uniref:Uncharacterized protein n=1 Tax=Cryptolaemus montrouzieri TaxID=559131 RepID=A0ABD2NMJ0_9CUCU
MPTRISIVIYADSLAKIVTAKTDTEVEQKASEAVTSIQEHLKEKKLESAADQKENTFSLEAGDRWQFHRGETPGEITWGYSGQIP